jgi:predicted methyltransferase MtxX (methanogen marker protein 4)
MQANSVLSVVQPSLLRGIYILRDVGCLLEEAVKRSKVVIRNSAISGLVDYLCIINHKIVGGTRGPFIIPYYFAS